MFLMKKRATIYPVNGLERGNKIKQGGVYGEVYY